VDGEVLHELRRVSPLLNFAHATVQRAMSLVSGSMPGAVVQLSGVTGAVEPLSDVTTQ